MDETFDMLKAVDEYLENNKKLIERMQSKGLMRALMPRSRSISYTRPSRNTWRSTVRMRCFLWI